MTSLLDTCVILWAARDQDQLSACVRGLLLDSRQALVVSVVSAWEIALKPELGISDAAGWLRAGRRTICKLLSCRCVWITSRHFRHSHYVIEIHSIAC
jgi:PIN domain nuclease of toxin-antitoxin system